MNDLRSPSEDRPYRPSSQTPRLAQDDVDPEYGMTIFDRVRYSRWFPLASVFAAVLIFSGIVSYAYKQGSQTGVNATTPVVAADNKDYKAKPANPGGMDVPFQDAVVFDQLQNKDAAKPGDKTESLLPAPEQPVANGAAPAAATTTPAPPAAPGTTPTAAITTPPAANSISAADPLANPTTAAANPAAPATTTPATPATAATTTAGAPASTTAAVTTPAVPAKTTEAASSASVAAAITAASAPAEEEEDAAPAPVEKPVAKKAVAKKAAAVPAPKTVASAAPKTAAPKAETGTYRIQLGAFRDEAAAHAAWSKVQKQYGVLSGVSSAFPRADLGAKGVFYRAQGINLSKSSADNFCHTINAGKAGSCIVTH